MLGDPIRNAPELEPEPSSHTRLTLALLATGRGDRESFAEVYTLTASAVFGLVKRVLRDHAQSEEVAQEVLLDVWRTASRYEPDKGSARAWIMTMAHRRAVDRVRSEQAWTTRTQRAASFDLSPDVDWVSEEVGERLEAEAVRSCLASLTPIQRESIVHAYYGGMTYTEVATHLGVPLGTIKTRIRDGLIRLRDCLGATALA